jgi:hypothetical protein
MLSSDARAKEVEIMDVKMECTVGQTAGKVWMLLGERGSVAIPRISKLLKEKSEVVYQALGWLARENKIRYGAAGSNTVSLNDSEAQAYRHLFAAKAQTASSGTGTAPLARNAASAEGKTGAQQTR